MRFDSNIQRVRRSVIVRYINRYFELALILVLISIAGALYYSDSGTQTLAQMRERGYMRVLISDDPDSIYQLNSKYYGFEYELLKKFADEEGLELRLDIVPFAQLFALLESGAGDIAVGGILLNPYVKRVSQPTIPWFQARTTVVYKRGTTRPKTLEHLKESPIVASARYYQIEGFEELQVQDDHRSEYALLNAVHQGNVRFALSTNYRAKAAKHYLPQLNRSFILPTRANVVWSLPKRHDAELLAQINKFLESSLKSGLPKKLAENYLAIPNRLSTYDAMHLHGKILRVLPKYEYAFRKAARRHNIDWTLLAALAYQESRWSNEARSPTGVRGLMQMTEVTAASLGVTDRMDMAQSIGAAARYLVSLRNRLPKRIKEPDRTWFALGAYNMGYTHILNAYKQARELGVDRSQWGVVSQLLPTLYGTPFDKGLQAQNYVERIQLFADVLRFYDLHQREEIMLKPEVMLIEGS